MRTAAGAEPEQHLVGEARFRAPPGRACGSRPRRAPRPSPARRSGRWPQSAGRRRWPAARRCDWPCPGRRPRGDPPSAVPTATGSPPARSTTKIVTAPMARVRAVLERLPQIAGHEQRDLLVLDLQQAVERGALEVVAPEVVSAQEQLERSRHERDQRHGRDHRQRLEEAPAVELRHQHRGRHHPGQAEQQPGHGRAPGQDAQSLSRRTRRWRPRPAGARSCRRSSDTRLEAGALM